MDTTPIPLTRSLIRAVARSFCVPEPPPAAGADPVCSYLLRTYGAPDVVALAFARVEPSASGPGGDHMRESIRSRLFS